MFAFRKKGKPVVREADDHHAAAEEPGVQEGPDEGMEHIQRCYLVRNVIDDLARVDPQIHEMVLEDRIGFVGDGCNAPVGHVVVHADDLTVDMTNLGPLEVLVAIAQLIGQARLRPEGRFELRDELRSAREASSANPVLAEIA